MLWRIRCKPEPSGDVSASESDPREVGDFQRRERSVRSR